jgi:hypothetical protein
MVRFFASLDVVREIRLGWSLVMTRDFFDPTPEEQQVVLIDAETLRKAEKLIESCEGCNPEGAEIPFTTYSTASPAQIRA